MGRLQVQLHAFVTSTDADVVTFTPRLLELWVSRSLYPLNKSLAAPESTSGRFGKDKSLLLLSGIESNSLVDSPVIIPSEQTRDLVCYL